MEATNARFAPGQAVWVLSREPQGHCRTPLYLRGKPGVVEEVAGIYRDPEKLAYHRPGLPRQVLYRVRFRQDQLWPAYRGPAGDTLVADIYEHWLAQQD